MQTQKTQKEQSRKMDKEELNKLSKIIIGIAIDIHKQLGPGFAEKIYQRVLYLELKQRGIHFEREWKITIKWNKVIVGYHIVDFTIENELLVEIKTVSEIMKLHESQMLSYLKASNKRLGLILNFGQTVLEIRRVVNRF